jgi:hypothetical protein
MAINYKTEGESFYKFLHELMGRENHGGFSDYNLLCCHTYECSFKYMWDLTEESTLEDFNNQLRSCLEEVIQFPSKHNITLDVQNNQVHLRYLTMVSAIRIKLGMRM